MAITKDQALLYSLLATLFLATILFPHLDVAQPLRSLKVGTSTAYRIAYNLSPFAAYLFVVIGSFLLSKHGLRAGVFFGTAIPVPFLMAQVVRVTLRKWTGAACYYCSLFPLHLLFYLLVGLGVSFLTSVASRPLWQRSSSHQHSADNFTTERTTLS